MIFSRSRHPQRHLPDINVTSFIDVVLLLLIFFMVSTTFDRFGELRIELPRAEAGATGEGGPEPLILRIDREGHFSLATREIGEATVAAVREALSDALGGRAAVPLRIDADARSPYQALITAMDAAAQAGLTQVAFTTLPSPAVPGDAAPVADP